jgi:hypothetical protein
LKLLRAIVATVVLLGFSALLPNSVRAEEPRVSIVLDDFTPLLAQPGRKLTITGRVVNLGAETLTDARLELRVSEQPLANRAAAGSIDTGPASPGRFIDAARVTLDDTVASRGQRPFTITVPFNDLALPTDGTYVVAINLTAVTNDQVAATTSINTFLPWFPRGAPGQRTYTPIKVVWLWPFVDWPARSASGTLLDEQTPREISPGGRLNALAAIAQNHPRAVSAIADPALLQTAADMTTGYQVIRDGRVVIGDRGDAAAAWLTTLRNLSSEPLWVLPYADIDASASRRADLATEVVRAVTQSGPIAQRSLGEGVQSGLYWAPFGRLDNATASLLSSAGVSTVVLSAAALPDEQTITPTGRATLGTSLGALDAILVDPTLATLLTAPQQTRHEVLLARQRFLAETALIATQVDQETDVRTIVIAPRNIRWNPNPDLINPLLRASSRASWMTPTTLDALLAETPPNIPRDRAGYGDRARAAELSEQYLNQVRRVAQRIELFSSILDNPGGTTEPFAQALLRAQSSAWRSEPEVGTTLLRSIRTEINQVINQVRVLSTGNITFSGDVGRVPITIANDLDQSVTVGLRLIGKPAARLSAADITGIQIEAGRKASIDIDARVIGGEPLSVNVQLLTPDGELYGTPTAIEVNSTAYARAASWVVVAAFIALAVFVVVGVTRRIHQARKSSAGI